MTQNSFVLQWGVIVEKPKGMDEKMTDKLSRVFTEGVSKGFLQDVEIWKHKTRIDNPLLVEEDGAVYQLRRWYQQFYVDVADIETGNGGTLRDRGGHHPRQRVLEHRGRREPAKATWMPKPLRPREVPVETNHLTTCLTISRRSPTSIGSPGRCCCCMVIITTTTISTGAKRRVWILVEVKGFQ